MTVVAKFGKRRPWPLDLGTTLRPVNVRRLAAITFRVYIGKLFDETFTLMG